MTFCKDVIHAMLKNKVKKSGRLIGIELAVKGAFYIDIYSYMKFGFMVYFK